MLATVDAHAARDRAIQWMNRGHALSQRDAGMEALVAYAHAIALLRPLPVGENPSWANSLGAALMNYGGLLHRVYGVARAAEALAVFSEAIALLAAISSADLPWASRNLAGTYLNRANLLLDLAAEGRAVLQPALGAPNARAEAPRYLINARADAEASLALIAVSERTDFIDADLALKARRVLCDALGQEIVCVPLGQQDAVADEAGDVVDAALALIRHWHTRGEGTFAILAVRFFRFGTELYRRHQPHFLVEFIEENLALKAAEDLQAIACAALDAVLADGAAPTLVTMDDPASERALRTRCEIMAARARLGALSRVA